MSTAPSSAPPFCVDCDSGSSTHWDQVAVMAVICEYNKRRDRDCRGVDEKEIVGAFSQQWDNEGRLSGQRILVAISNLLEAGMITHFFGKVGTCSLGHRYTPVKGYELVIRVKES